MNAPAPGWHPDPTARPEYRYWDGSRWTDDVSDGGVTSVDPATPGQAAGFPSGDATAPYSPTPTPSPSDPYGGPSGGFPPYGAGPGPGPGTGPGMQPMPGQPVKKGPSTGLLVGIGLVVVALIAGLAFVLTSGGDDDNDGDEISSGGSTTTTTTAGGETTTTAGGETTTTTSGGGGTEDDALVEAMATALQTGSDGILTTEESECIAQGMVDQFGTDRLIDMGLDSSTDPFAEMSTEDQTALVSLMLDCVPAEKLADLGEMGTG
jgi:Protein of unknown function (DUF2510)